MQTARSVLEIAEQAEALATPHAVRSEIHGPEHWRDVARVGGHILAAADRGADVRSLLIFAAVHDTQRHSDGHDPEHGSRAAEVLVADIDHGLDPERLDVLVHALRHHTGGETHEDPTIAACWDADRLTLDRVFITPDPRFLSTPPVRDRFDEFHRLGRAIVFGPDMSWGEILGS